jgi:hypothetical protein
MRERAPHQYRTRFPAPIAMPGVVDLASGERFELARRLTAVYEAIQVSAINDSREGFAGQLAERFAVAMEFQRVAIWIVTSNRQEIVLFATHGDWFAPGDEPKEMVRIPFDPVTMYASLPDVYDGIHCWLCEPRPERLNRAFSTALVANQQLVGYIIGDRNGEDFSLTPSQIELGDGLASHFANVFVLRRSHDLEVKERLRTLDAANDYARAIEHLANAFNKGTDMTAVMRQAVQSAVRLSGAHLGELLLRSSPDTARILQHRVEHDWTEEIVPLDLSMLPGAVRVRETGSPVLVSRPDAAAIERIHLRAYNAGSCLYVPLEVDGDLAGVMRLMFSAEQPDLSTWHLSVCETMAETCVAAIVKQRFQEAVSPPLETTDATGEILNVSE